MPLVGALLLEFAYFLESLFQILGVTSGLLLLELKILTHALLDRGAAEG